MAEYHPILCKVICGFLYPNDIPKINNINTKWKNQKQSLENNSKTKGKWRFTLW